MRRVRRVRRVRDYGVGAGALEGWRAPCFIPPLWVGVVEVVSGVTAGELVFASLGDTPDGLDEGFADWSGDGVPDVLVEFGITVPALVSALVFALLPWPLHAVKSVSAARVATAVAAKSGRLMTPPSIRLVKIVLEWLPHRERTARGAPAAA